MTERHQGRSLMTWMQQAQVPWITRTWCVGSEHQTGIWCSGLERGQESDLPPDSRSGDGGPKLRPDCDLVPLQVTFALLDGVA
jgi:hypothetical protein